MRRLLLLTIVLLVLAVTGAGARTDVNCTLAVKQQRTAAVSAFRHRAARERAAYFKRHRNASDRRRFVARQNAQLARLQAAAACTVPPPGPPTPADPPPPTATGGFSPSLEKPGFADNRSVDDPWVGEWGPKTDGYFLSGSGTLRTLVVPIDFSDAPATRPVLFYSSIFARATTWFTAASYGKLDFQVTTVDRWVRMPKPVQSYGVSRCCNAQAVKDLMQDVVTALDPSVDFSKVDSVYAVGPESSGPYLDILVYQRWPGAGIVADGKELRQGVVGNGNFRDESTAKYLAMFMEHDTGHLMGLSDLYGRVCATCQDTHDLVGTWTTMDTAPPDHDFLGWDKWLLGWIEPTQIVGVTSGSVETTLAPTETPGGNKLVVVPITPSFLYAIEVRQPLKNDADLCSKGVLVYTVQSDVMNAQGAVHVKQAQGSDPQRNGSCGPIWNATFDLGSDKVASFDDDKVKVEVLATDGRNYTIRVTKK